MPRALETNAAHRDVPADGRVLRPRASTTTSACRSARAVTLDDVNAAARRVLDPARATVVIAGPYEDSELGNRVISVIVVIVTTHFSRSVRCYQSRHLSTSTSPLINPGPTFRGEGYQAFCARHGMEVDASRFDERWRAPRRCSTGRETRRYDAEIFVAYTRHIIEQMGGPGRAARRLRARDLRGVGGLPALRAVRRRRRRCGAICAARRPDRPDLELAPLPRRRSSRTSSCEGLIAAAMSSSEHGFMKPHPSIFRGGAAAGGRGRASEAVMVGDSVQQDVEGALRRRDARRAAAPGRGTASRATGRASALPRRPRISGRSRRAAAIPYQLKRDSPDCSEFPERHRRQP